MNPAEVSNLQAAFAYQSDVLKDYQDQLTKAQAATDHLTQYLRLLPPPMPRKLSQGRRLAADYAIKFRTLAAQSGWNNVALKAVFQRSLNIELQAELASRSSEAIYRREITTGKLMTCASTVEKQATAIQYAHSKPGGASMITARVPLAICSRPSHLMREVFSKTKATQLPPHRPWDCTIDLLPNAMPPKSKVYPLSRPEIQAMEDYIEEALSSGFIRPSTSPAAAGFFFVEKKDGGLRPCIDYRGLNNVTVKFRYPLPLVPAALEQLRETKFYTKLDLRSAYNLIRALCRRRKWPEAEVAGSIRRAGGRKHTVREVRDKQKVGNRKTRDQALISRG
ncbi:hypothetical protein QTP70_012816 [Hemibagrus guttatus]|uniref:Reverse transcriptase domain-containing protein n=1 Tax=Hemibagrus guttatus TaxID=175788 RepID=A0AAE0Q0D1_9TELE|nr:hypothetical protein QTP70_012816 [Hemibagrus guttatus]